MTIDPEKVVGDEASTLFGGTDTLISTHIHLRKMIADLLTLTRTLRPQCNPTLTDFDKFRSLHLEIGILLRTYKHDFFSNVDTAARLKS